MVDSQLRCAALRMDAHGRGVRSKLNELDTNARATLSSARGLSHTRVAQGLSNFCAIIE